MKPEKNPVLNGRPLAPLCILCGSDARGHSLFPGILKCPSCGLVFASVQTTPDDLKSLYQHSYFFGEEYLNYVEDKPTHQTNFRRRLLTLEQFSSGGRLFEVGCAYGFFLELARKTWRAEGCDISQEACEEARRNQLTVQCGDFLELPLPAETYDAVCLWDTIEHLGRPDLYVEKAATILKRGGFLCITTGDIGSLTARVRKHKWRLIHPPTHLFYFDRVSITRLLDQKGFDIAHFEHCGYNRSLHQMLYSLLLLNHQSRWRTALYNSLKPLFGFSLYLNLFDIMFVIARRRG